jgi:hypothetical protein
MAKRGIPTSEFVDESWFHEPWLDPYNRPNGAIIHEQQGRNGAWCGFVNHRFDSMEEAITFLESRVTGFVSISESHQRNQSIIKHGNTSQWN